MLHETRVRARMALQTEASAEAMRMTAAVTIVKGVSRDCNAESSADGSNTTRPM